MPDIYETSEHIHQYTNSYQQKRWNAFPKKRAENEFCALKQEVKGILMKTLELEFVNRVPKC